MRITELVLGAIAIIAIILNFMCIPGGVVLTALSIFTLAVFYFSSTVILIRRQKKEEVFHEYGFSPVRGSSRLGIVTGIAFSLTCVAILFKLMYWPMYQILLLVAIAILSGTLILNINKIQSNPTGFNKNIFRRFIVLGAIATALLFTPMASLFEFKYRNHPNVANALKETLKDPGNQVLWEKVKLEKQKMDEASL